MRVTVGAIFPNREVAEDVRGALLHRNVQPHHVFVEALVPSAAAVLGPYLGLSADDSEQYESLARSGALLVGVRVSEGLRPGIERLFEQRGGTLVSQASVAS